MVLRDRRLLRRAEGARRHDRRRLCHHSRPACGHGAGPARSNPVLGSATLARRRVLALQAPGRLTPLLLRAAAVDLTQPFILRQPFSFPRRVLRPGFAFWLRSPPTKWRQSAES